MSEFDFRAPTLSEAHSHWHAVNGALAVCPLDCGIGYDMHAEAEAAGWYDDEATQVSCGHCKGRHSVEQVKECAAAAWQAKAAAAAPAANTSVCAECGDAITFTHHGRGMLWVSYGPKRRGPKCEDGWGHVPQASL